MVLATLFVGVTAFRLAYGGSKGAAVDAGLSDDDAAWYPLCVEGVLVVAAIGTALLPGRRYPWVVLLGFSGLSVGANMIHAVDQPGRCDWFTLLIAAVPPTALPLCAHLIVCAVRGARTHLETDLDAHLETLDSGAHAHSDAHQNAHSEEGAHTPEDAPPSDNVRTITGGARTHPAEVRGTSQTRTRVGARKGARSRAVECDCGCARTVDIGTRRKHRRAAGITA